MRDPATFRKYANECYRLSRLMPSEHRQALIEIAEAWLKCAEDAESETKANDSSDTNESSEESPQLTDIGPTQHQISERPPPVASPHELYVRAMLNENTSPWRGCGSAVQQNHTALVARCPREPFSAGTFRFTLCKRMIPKGCRLFGQDHAPDCSQASS
jgi:hypothetical protein